MTARVYSGAAAEHVWAGLRSAGCSSAFALPCAAPKEVWVNIGQVDRAERWLADRGFIKAPRRAQPVQQQHLSI